MLDITPTFWSSTPQGESPSLSTQDGAVLAVLRDRRTQRRLVAGCTHLFWDPRYPDIKASVGCVVTGKVYFCVYVCVCEWGGSSD